MVRSLPLRSGFFATPQVTLSDENDLLLWARALVPDLHHPEAEWTLLQEKKGVQVMEDRQKGGLTYSIKSVATVKASLDDIMELFAAPTTAAFRTLMQLQLRECFADAAVLFQSEQNESETLAIKWLAMRNKKSAINPMVHLHDFCVMEYTGVIGADAIGGDPDKPIGVCMYESIEQMECPPLYESHKLERGSLSKCGYLFRPREEGVVEAQFVCSVRQPPNKSSKRRMNRSLLLNWAESVGVIEESISRKRISRELTLRRQPTWVNDKDRQCCHLCLKTFTNTRRKHHCRACGEIICRSCSLYKSVDLQSVGLTTLRVCKACMDGTKTDKDSQAATTPNSVSSSSVDKELVLPKGVDDEKLRDAVEEYALALPSQQSQVSTVPDLVGMAWLRQIAARDPSKKDMVADLMERLRLESQDKYAVQDEKEEQVDIYDTLCDLAAQALSCKYAVVSLIDENRQWFKSAVNVRESDVPRDFSFCEYPVRDQRPLVVMDALRDPRFMSNPFVTGPLAVRFLAGAPLFTVDNECVGAVCVLDTEPRHTLPENQVATMQNLAHLAMVMVQERREAQNKFARAALTSQLVPRSHQMHPLNYNQNPYHQQPQHFHPNYNVGPQHGLNDGHKISVSSSDMVPLSSYSGESSMIVQAKPREAPREDPVLKEQMIQLLHKASQVRDQVNLQSQTNAQHAGLQSSGE
ncbi:hypothetical protein FI667_g10445, partial [Globisporangium splendens]